MGPRSNFDFCEIGANLDPKNSRLHVASVAAGSQSSSSGDTRMAGKKPNILVLWGDDIGIWNISHNSRGMMGYRTPNIDRVAEEGVTFTDYYAQQSCTAGRAC